MLLRPQIILDKVCAVTGIGEKDILSGNRQFEVVKARVLYWITLRMNGYTTSGIGVLTNRDNTTVAKQTRKYEKAFKNAAESILNELGGTTFKMMVQPQELHRMTKKERSEFCSEITTAPKNPYIPPKRHKIVMKKIPDYQNYCVKTIWRVEK